MCLNSVLAAANNSSHSLDIGIHRAADIEEHQHLHGVVPLRDQLQIEIALVGGVLDRARQIELGFGALAGPFAQTAKCDLDIAGAQFDRIVEIFVFALVPDLDGLPWRPLSWPMRTPSGL